MGSVNRYLYEEFETAPTVENLCDTFNKALEEGIVDPLILIPVFIHDFLCIHPFRDGNGRMSRLLTALLLYRSGYYVGKYVLDKRFHMTPHEEESFSLEFLQFQRMGFLLQQWHLPPVTTIIASPTGRKLSRWSNKSSILEYATKPIRAFGLDGFLEAIYWS